MPSLRSCGQSVTGALEKADSVCELVCAAVFPDLKYFCLECHGASSGVSGVFLQLFLFMHLLDEAMPQGRHSQPSSNWVGDFYGSFKVLLID